MRQLDGLTIVLTGASGGIGSVMSRVFAGAGASVAMVDINGDGIRALADQLADVGGRVLPIEADLTQRARAAEIVAEVQAKFGDVDVLVNNATWATYQKIDQIDEETVDRMLAAGLKQVFWMTQAVVPSMIRKGGGSIVNMSSISALTGMAYSPVYAAIKAGIDGFTRALAVDLGAQSIRVNSVAPSAIPSPMSMRILDESAWEGRRKRTPLGRIGTANDIAQAVMFLASPASSFITGEVLRADGGYCIGGAIPGVDVAVK
jgi:NAD(P)-dependent dehydrogenase (short-subunit alcohol dehydrogenase family)